MAAGARPRSASGTLTLLALLGSTPALVADLADVEDLGPPPGLRAVCAATAPTVLSPVALDWTAQGQLWVAERVPASDLAPAGGRVVRLEDTDGDGVFDRRTVFLAGLPPVSSVMDWPPGVLIAAAPDLLYGEDSTGNGVADVARRLFVGFGAGSAARRFNSLTFGLDGWVYASNGLAGGRVQPLEAYASDSPVGEDLIVLEETDFRFSPEQGRLEPVAGLSWIGRARDESGSWVGLDGDLGLVQFPLPRHYALRNPSFAFPDPVTAVRDLQGRPLLLGRDAGIDQVDPGRPGDPPGGAELHRARALGPVRRGDLLVASPGGHRILRVPLRFQGLGFVAAGATETLLSADPAVPGPGFTPTQIRSGPDDAIWIADPGRSADSASLPAGRIIRLVLADRAPPRLADRLAPLDTQPARALASPNGALRDLAHRRIVVAKAAIDAPSLRALGRNREHPFLGELSDSEMGAVRAQTLSVLHQLGQLRFSDLAEALADPEPTVRLHALRSYEAGFREGRWPDDMDHLTKDPDPGVRFQAALSIGEATHPAAAALWTRMARAHAQEPWMRAALLSSASRQPLHLLARWLESNSDDVSPGSARDLTRDLIRTARIAHSPESIAETLSASDSTIALVGVAALIESESSPALDDPHEVEWLARLEPWIARARTLIQTGRCNESDLPLALSVLGAQPRHFTQDSEILLRHARSGLTSPVRETALATLLRSPDPDLPHVLLSQWPLWRPSLRPTLLAALTLRTSWIAPLLRALEAGALTASELSPAQQDRLRHHPDPQIRSEAAALLAALLPPPRAEARKDYRGALGLEGNASNGRQTFDDRCAVCHAPPFPLLPIGPDLATIGSRTPAELALAILDPNALVEPDYRAFFIDSSEDESVTGILRRETDRTLELLLVGGRASSLPLDRAREIRASNVSLMPEGLEVGLSPQSFADLLAYLEALR